MVLVLQEPGVVIISLVSNGANEPFNDAVGFEIAGFGFYIVSLRVLITATIIAINELTAVIMDNTGPCLLSRSVVEADQ